MGLALKRKIGQSLVINDDFEIIVLDVRGTKPENFQVTILVIADRQKYQVLRNEIATDRSERIRMLDTDELPNPS